MKKSWLLFFSISFLLLSSLPADDDHPTGTLIVTYSTDNKGERLDRIRFWLQQKGTEKRSFYPKQDTFVEDHVKLSRKVVIENLLPGQYSLQFLIPNADDYFALVKKRDITIQENEVVKLDQQILPKHKTAKEKDEEKISELKTKAESEQKKQQKGKLILSYTTDAFELIDSISTRLVDENGVVCSNLENEETTIPLHNGKMLMLQEIPTGTYAIAFYLDNDNPAFHVTKECMIEPDRTTSLHESLPMLKNLRKKEEHSAIPSEEKVLIQSDSITHEGENRVKNGDQETFCTLTVTANVPTAIYTLENAEKSGVWEGTGRLYSFEALTPGLYHLNYSSSDPFFTPPSSQMIDLTKNDNLCIETIFDTLGKLKIASNIKDAIATITHVDNTENTRRVQIKNGVGTAYLPEGEYRISFNTPGAQRKIPHPMKVFINSLQTKEIKAYFEREWVNLDVQEESPNTSKGLEG